MDKGIGFNRQLLRRWLDAVAVFVTETEDAVDLRARLEDVLAHDMKGVDARRKTIDLLLNIWLHTREDTPGLWSFAVHWAQATPSPDDRVWLHYGLTLLYYPFFRACVAAIGQYGRYDDHITTRALIRHLAADVGQLGSLERSVQRVVASLRDWGALVDAERRYTYIPQGQCFVSEHIDVQTWLLACALYAHPAEELPFADLLRLPELFPFRFTVGLEQVRAAQWFIVQRQGAGWDMVRLQADTIAPKP